MNQYHLELINDKLLAAQEAYATMLSKYCEAIPATASSEEIETLKTLFNDLQNAIISVQETIIKMNISPDSDKTQLQ